MARTDKKRLIQKEGKIVKMKIKTEGTMAYVHLDDEEREMIKKHIIKESEGYIEIHSVTLNCIVFDKTSYPSQGLEYPLKHPITITKS